MTGALSARRLLLRLFQMRCGIDCEVCYNCALHAFRVQVCITHEDTGPRWDACRHRLSRRHCGVLGVIANADSPSKPLEGRERA